MAPVRVTILMATYNGAAGLPAQLASFTDQSHSDWDLMVSDDGSTDATSQQIADFAQTQGDQHNVQQLRGPGRGAAQNFMHLIRHAPAGAWVAFADQDDVWLPHKLTRSLEHLAHTSGPALYCSRTWITTPSLSPKRLSVPRPKPASFQNALVQNIASGNTILLNPAATDLARAAAQVVDDIMIHDWWLYQLITGAGGTVVHDDRPSLYYCQHGHNQIGANDTTRARLWRIWQLINGQYRVWTDQNIATLKACAPWMTAPHNDLVAALERGRTGPMRDRMRMVSRLGLYRQTPLAQLALRAAAVAKRL